jgi:hypothetical protein
MRRSLAAFMNRHGGRSRYCQDRCYEAIARIVKKVEMLFAHLKRILWIACAYATERCAR